MNRRPPRSPLFPYPPLFRSRYPPPHPDPPAPPRRNAQSRPTAPASADPRPDSETRAGNRRRKRTCAPRSSVSQPLKSPDAEKRFDFRIAEHRSVLADKLTAVLTMTAEPHRAMHVALHVEIDAVFGHAVLEQMVHGGLHHALGTAQHDHCAGRIDLHLVKQLRDMTDVPRPK